MSRHYEPALRLAQVVIRNTSLLDRLGTVEAFGFLLDTPTLFQRWVTDRLRRHLDGQLEVIDEPTEYLGKGRRVAMAPDLVIRERHGRTVYVGDVKYKLSSGAARSSDYYQLLAYTTALRLDEGVLIYCQADSSPPEHEVVVRATGTKLWTYRLPMAGSTTEVEAGVEKLAEWLLARVGATDHALSGLAV